MKNLTGRDKVIFKGLHEFGLLSTRQIQRMYFYDLASGEVDRRTVLRRLRKLAKGKWILRHKTSRGGEVIWTLSAKGAKFLGSEFFLKGINRASLYHDLLVSDVRIELDKLSICKHWKSSHALRYGASIRKNPYARTPDSIPDWLFSMKLKSKSVTMAMEVELNFKGTRRMEKVLEMYSQKKVIDHIWYVVPNQKFGEKVLKSASEFVHRHGKVWVFYSVISDILGDTKCTKIYHLDGSITLAKLCDLPAHSPAHSVGTEEFKEAS